LKQEFVARSDLEWAALAHVKRSLVCRFLTRRAVGNRLSTRAAEPEPIALHAEDRGRFISGERAALLMKDHDLSGLVLLRAALLGIGPRERIEDITGYFLFADDTLTLQRFAHTVGNGVDFRPCWRDNQCRTAALAAFGCVEISGGGAFVEPGGLLDHFARRVEAVKGFGGLLVES